MVDAATIETDAPVTVVRVKRHWARRLFNEVLVLLLALLALAAIGLVLLDTSPGHRFIVDRIGRLETATGLKIRIARIDGSIFGNATLKGVSVADPQGVFLTSPEIEIDWAPGTLHVVGLSDGTVVGAVRLYPLDADGLWKGDRLAVLAEARVRRLGAELVRFAVATAGEQGGHTMVAQIQLPNVQFFEHLGWHADGPPAPYHGVMHQPMAIPLAPAP